jgi:HSP20 family protein
MKRYELTTAPFNNLFETFFSDLPTLNRGFFPETREWAHFRVKEQEEGFVVEAELAGVKKEDLKIEVLGDQLKISGSRGSKEEKDSFEYAEFSKSFTLGKGIDTDKIEAKFENGYLNLLIPRSEAAKPRFIDVK